MLENIGWDGYEWREYGAGGRAYTGPGKPERTPRRFRLLEWLCALLRHPARDEYYSLQDLRWVHCPCLYIDVRQRPPAPTSPPPSSKERDDAR